MAYLRTTAGEAREGLQAAHVTNMAALTSVASVGVPTKTEFDKTVADLAAARTTIQALLTSLRNSGLIASS